MRNLPTQFLLFTILLMASGCGLATGPLELPPIVLEATIPGDEVPIVRDAGGGFAPQAVVEAAPNQRVIYKGISN